VGRNKTRQSVIGLKQANWDGRLPHVKQSVMLIVSAKEILPTTKAEACDIGRRLLKALASVSFSEKGMKP